jgi:hypothetical protein
MENRAAHRVVSLVTLLLLCFLSWQSARAGYAALLTARVTSLNDLPAVSKAVRLSPGNAHTHVLLGALLEASDDRAAAIAQYQTAVALRPDDYVVRMQLARGQELDGDTIAAITNGRVAVNLAPFYAQPHWQLGNILVRAGRNEEGFQQLRLAGASDHALWPPVIDLAWQVSHGDASFVKRELAPQAPADFLALGDYLKKRKQVAEAVAMFSAAGDGAEAVQARRQYVNELINAKEFRTAFELWKINPNVTSASSEGIIDSGFEMESDLNESFGWRAIDLKETTLSLDNANPEQGRTSLRVDFNGAANAGADVISQLVLVTPKTHYKLSLNFRSDSIVSGGLPNVAVVDAGDNKLLGQTGALSQTTNSWQLTTIEFTTGDSTSAIRIALQRLPCPTLPCPIFGKLWLDDFVLMGPGFVGEG